MKIIYFMGCLTKKYLTLNFNGFFFMKCYQLCHKCVSINMFQNISALRNYFNGMIQKNFCASPKNDIHAFFMIFRSTEEIFSLFISIAFIVDAGRDMYKNFNHNYFSHACMEEGSTPSVEFPLWIANSTINETTGEVSLTQPCKRENSLLFLLLMCGTVWLAVSLYNFNKTPYLQASKREILADYALPVAVISMSFLGSFVFRDVATDQFRYSDNHPLTRAPVEELPWTASIAALGMGFALSLLFFMDQNISAAMVNNPCNKLKKGPAYHLDLFVVGVVNGFLSLYGLPWMHGVLPHSPLHVRSLADVEERVEQGHVYEIIVKVRETRVTGIISHILIGLSIFLLPYPMAYIPTAVLDGLFLYMAITSLNGNQMFERITLLFMEQVLIFTVYQAVFCFTNGSLSPKSLHTKMSSTKDPHLHNVPSVSVGNYVFLWILSLVVR
ncbi:UNVERIFIED_CONTAM: Sodium bicarbonate transporter-like protein 11 [Trichonephila clavipes]